MVSWRIICPTRREVAICLKGWGDQMRTGNLKGKLWHPNPERLGGFIHFHLLQREGAGSVDRKRFSSNLQVHSLSASWDSQGQGQETTNLIWIPHMSDRTLNHCFPGHTDRKRSHVEWHCHRGHRQLNLLTTKPSASTAGSAGRHTGNRIQKQQWRPQGFLPAKQPGYRPSTRTADSTFTLDK